MRVTRGSFGGGLHGAGDLLGIDDHRPELEGGEHPAVLADTLLRKEHRPAVFELDRRARSAATTGENTISPALETIMSNNRFTAGPPLLR